MKKLIFLTALACDLAVGQQAHHLSCSSKGGCVSESVSTSVSRETLLPDLQKSPWSSIVQLSLLPGPKVRRTPEIIINAAYVGNQLFQLWTGKNKRKH